MSDDTKYIKNSLDYIISETYGNDNQAYFYFHISLVPKELTKKHAHYLYKEKKVEIFNLTRPPKHLLMTCLHEVSHHIQYINEGFSNHEQEFYQILYDLIKSAISLKLLDKEDVVSQKDATDSHNLQTYFGFIDEWQIEESSLIGQRVLTVKNGFHYQELLKKLAFKWLSQSQTWIKEVSTDSESRKIKSYLKRKTKDQIQITIRNKHDITFDYYFYLAVEGGYEYRKMLKERGYQFNGYGHENSKLWIKKVLTREYYKEIEALTVCNGIQYKRVQPKKVKPKKEMTSKETYQTTFVPVFFDE